MTAALTLTLTALAWTAGIIALVVRVERTGWKVHR